MEIMKGILILKERVGEDSERRTLRECSLDSDHCKLIPNFF
jgi:hypothetical protein